MSSQRGSVALSPTNFTRHQLDRACCSSHATSASSTRPRVSCSRCSLMSTSGVRALPPPSASSYRMTTTSSPESRRRRPRDRALSAPSRPRAPRRTSRGTAASPVTQRVLTQASSSGDVDRNQPLARGVHIGRNKRAGSQTLQSSHYRRHRNAGKDFWSLRKSLRCCGMQDQRHHSALELAIVERLCRAAARSVPTRCAGLADGVVKTFKSKDFVLKSSS